MMLNANNNLKKIIYIYRTVISADPDYEGGGRKVKRTERPKMCLC